MHDLVIGAIVLMFVLLGTREGLIKSLGSAALVFLSLFLAAGAISVFGQIVPQFSEPKYEGTIIAVLLVWVLCFVFLDLLLTLLLKKLVKIIVLGPLDMVGGLLAGGVKGLLICAVVLQFVLALPLQDELAGKLKEAAFTRISFALYESIYPGAKQIFSSLAGFIDIELIEKINGLKTVPSREIDAEKIIPPQVKEYQETLRGGGRIQQLIKEQQLLPAVPQAPIDGIKR